MKYTKAEVAEARESLKGILRKGETVFTVLRHVSASGMQREIGLVVIRKGADGFMDYCLHPNHGASRLLGLRQGKRKGLIVDGCGMDMGWHLVSNLSHALYGDENALKHAWI